VQKTVSSAVKRRERAAWVAREILPHEPKVRAWLRRARTSPEDVYLHRAVVQVSAFLTSVDADRKRKPRT